MDPLVPPDVVDLYVETLKRLLEDPENDELLRHVQLKMEFDPRAFGKAAQKVLGDTEHVQVVSRIGTARAEEWQNVINNQHCTPSAVRTPTSLQDLIAIVQEAKSTSRTVRAVGSGHSFSNVAITYDFDSILVKPQGMKKVQITDPSVLSPDISSKLVTIESGITIADLNQTLDNMGLALTNMGAFDGQTLSGAISTGTHGTGVSLGPIGSSVRAVVLVSETGTVYQIEPVNGISDPEKFKNKHHDIVLKQDDDWFHSIVVSMGECTLRHRYEDSCLLLQVVWVLFMHTSWRWRPRIYSKRSVHPTLGRI
jgi:L-gulono-1,4-lactone dehydrogenase